MMNSGNDQRRAQARTLLNNGNTGEALLLLEQNIKNSPGDIESIYISGLCYATSSDYTSAEKLFSKVLKINPGLTQVYNDLGLSQYYQRKYNESIKSFNKSLKLNPRYAPALSGLALTYMHLNSPNKAIQYANKAVSIDNSNPRYLNIQALCNRIMGKIETAITIFRDIINTNPGFYDAYHNLYETLVNIEDFSSAETVLLSAKNIFKRNINLYVSLGKLYELNSHITKALEIYTEGMRNCGESPELLVSLGRVNISLKKFEIGQSQLCKALEIDKAFQPALTELCNFHILKREYEHATALVKNAIADTPDRPLNPGLSIAYGNACRLNDNFSESISTLNNVLKSPDLIDDTKAIAMFALGDTYDKLCDYDKAFDYYKKANTVAKKESDINYYTHILEDIKCSFTKDYICKIPHSDYTSNKPVFIVGMPRSGTSLIEQIISSHPQVFGAGEINNLWRIANEISNSMNLLEYTKRLQEINKEDINEYADQYLTFIEELDDNALRVTDKLPHNFMHIGLIGALFPNAKIIHCVRHPFDTCLSIYFKKFNSNHIYARKLNELAIFYKHYQDLMAHWDDVSEVNILNVAYEDLVINQEPITKNIIDYIDLDWNENCLSYYKSDRAIMTPSYAQANKPIYKDSMYRWRHYSKHIEPLTEILGDPEKYTL